MQATGTTPPDPKRMRRQAYMLGALTLVGAALGAYLVASGALPDQYDLKRGEPVPGITPSDGYEITVLMDELAAPRGIVASPDGEVIFVAERGAGRVIALEDQNEDQVADEPIVVADDLITPTGLAFHDGWLYIAEASQVIRVQVGDNWKETVREVVVKDLPSGKNKKEVESNQHALLIHNDELYVSIGASCPACEENDSRRATIMVYDLDGSNERVFARGLYQALGMVINPLNGELWASNQGRPQLPGDAPETLYALQNSDNAGWAGCIAGDIIAPESEDETACQGVVQPLAEFAPQGNVTGILFYDAPNAPEDYQGDLLVILNGGVNEAGRQVGMGILRLEVDPQTGRLANTEPQPFVTGFWLSEEPGDYLGRPYDLTMTEDGVIFISDDAAGAVYELRRKS